MSGFGGMVSFTFKSGKKKMLLSFLEKVKVFTLAESLGGVESFSKSSGFNDTRFDSGRQAN